MPISDDIFNHIVTHYKLNKTKNNNVAFIVMNDVILKLVKIPPKCIRELIGTASF